MRCPAKDRRRLDSKHHFSDRVIDRWNRLPQHIIDSASLTAFSSRLDRLRSASIGFSPTNDPPSRTGLIYSGIRCGRTWYVPGMFPVRTLTRSRSVSTVKVTRGDVAKLVGGISSEYFLLFYSKCHKLSSLSIDKHVKYRDAGTTSKPDQQLS